MSTQDQINKERDRKIAQNEEQRQMAGTIRVSGWAIFFAIVAGVIVFLVGWAWLHR
ncbi:hypothetical protein BRAS3843_2470035 [Bradyrhizobium sp. STM 3843]|uniref:hypothetical protein n=1 Tax=Bradyrhizobium sp. STM 3843 TaxID=551947 RepID=UPI0002403CBB|nr:hypothetical protein [Bradyrhizobium sp. STM 3843]CCE07899.1 hypothetical protein BRAS3843_2470035 [Bradyrhizobium sp. STM 3843]